MDTLNGWRKNTSYNYDYHMQSIQSCFLCKPNRIEPSLTYLRCHYPTIPFHDLKNIYLQNFVLPFKKINYDKVILI